MFNSLRTRLFLWYVLSLFLIGSFFYIFVHIRALPYGLELVVGLFVVLAIVGFVFIYRVTRSITNLTRQIKTISSKNMGERVLVRGNNEVTELAKAFNSLLDRLGEAFKREQQFIADVAHEMKTPLATLRSSLEVASSRDRSVADYKKVIDGSVSEVNTVSNTLNNVLDLAWLDAPTGRFTPEKFNLSDLVKELVELADKLGQSKEIQVWSEIAPQIFMTGYKEKLARAILNLVDNAVKYTPKGGRIEIRLESELSRTVIGITDTGPGISKEDQPYIFERFYRSPNMKRTPGTGLGLAICKSTVVLHHGEIKVKSEPGQGSTFVIVLPKS